MRKISRRSFIKAATFTAAAAALTACGGSSSSTTTASSTAASAAADNTPSNKGTGVTLNVYTNSDTDGRDEWLIERAAQDGFKVQVVGAGAADTQNRLLAEKASPIADVVFGLNAIIWESLKAENILIPFVPEWADEIPAGLNDDEGYYHAIVKQAILLVYDQNQLTEDQAPTDWPDLWTKPEFDKKYEYLTSLAGGTVRNVITGILTRYADPNGDLGIAQEGWDAIAEYYKHGVPNEDGVDLYAQIASENSTKNEEEAQRFVNWFGSAQIQGEWAEVFSTLPANTNAVGKANEFNQTIAELPAQQIDWALVAQNIDAWCEKIMLEYMP